MKNDLPEWTKKCPNECRQPANSSFSCPMTFFSASQLSTLVTLMLMLFLSAVEQYELIQGIKKDSAVRVIFFIQSTLAILIILIYYLLGAWQLEQDYFNKLKTLKPVYRFCEWYLRVLILCLIGFASLYVQISPKIPYVDTPERSSLFWLALCVMFFLVWDIIVFLGGGKDIAKDFLWKDIMGFLVIAFCLVMNNLGNLLAMTFSMALLLIYAAYTLAEPKEAIKQLLTSLKDINLQR